MKIKKGKPGRKHQYEFAFKRKVCEELLTGKITVGDLARKYAIPGAGTIMRWVKWYQQEQEELSSEMEKTVKYEESSDNSDTAKELERAKIKITALEIMIDIAENEYGIEIRKKSGTKPSLE